MTQPVLQSGPGRLLPRDTSTIRLAVAGLGKMGSVHLEAARTLCGGGVEDYYKGGLASQLSRLRICGICDPNPDRHPAAVGIPGYRDWKTLLRERQPHLAIIASPTATHADLTRQCLEAGVHALVEKPLTPRLEESRALIVLARQQGCRLLAGHVERYNPVSVKLKSWLAASGLAARYYRFERTQPLPARIPEDILTDKLIHDLDLALHFFGPVKHTRVSDCVWEEERIVEATVRLEHESGTRGSLFVSWRNREQPAVRRVNLLGTGRERIEGDFLAKTLTRDGEPVPCGVRGWVTGKNNQIKDQLTDFLATCLEPTDDTPPPLLTPEEILEAMRILDQIQTQAHYV